MKNPLKGKLKNPFKRKKQQAMTPAEPKKPAKIAVLGQGRPGRQYGEKKAFEPDPYYAKLSRISRFWRYIITFCLLIFAVGMTFLFSDEITAENFGLLLRNVSFSFPGENVEFTTVRYDADLEMDYAAYKEYFAVATTTGVRLYDHRGNIALDEKLSMTDPTLDAGERYLLAYDCDGYNYAICNSISLLYSGKEDYPIYCADMSDEGSYLLVSMSSSYRSHIKVYNRNFKQTRSLTVDRYPLSAKLCDVGQTMLYVSYTVSATGMLQGYVNLYDLSSKTHLLFEKTYESLPLHAVVFEDGAAVVFREGIRFYNRLGEYAFLSFEGKTPVYCGSSDEVLALSFASASVGGAQEIRFYDCRKGTLIADRSYEGRVGMISVMGRYVCLSDDVKTVIVDTASGKEQRYEGALPEKFVCSPDGTLFVCYGNKAENIAQLQTKEYEEQTASGEDA
ncbi:MAG: hypothetical protein IJZ37_05780 [Clostridia bacterium]|nr:hypothetical protein [Clostridia bacterium]